MSLRLLLNREPCKVSIHREGVNSSSMDCVPDLDLDINHNNKLTKEDDADNDGPGVLEQGVVEDPGGEGGDIEDGVNQSRIPVKARI